MTKFINHIMLRVSLWLLALLIAWAVLFFYMIVDEVNDETDDVLEDYSAMIIQNFLAGEKMPLNDNGSNNTYYLKAIGADSLDIVISKQGFANEDIYINYKKENEPARVLRQVFKDNQENYYEVTVITPTIDDKDLIEAIYSSLIILFALLLIIILIVCTLAIKSGLKPLKQLMALLNSSNIETIDISKIKEGKIKGNKIKEIKEIYSAIEAFAERDKRTFNEQKEFIGNASHELQTPIAICQNRLELLIESGLTEQQIEDVAGCLNTLSGMSKLNKTLLMLSKIENGGFENTTVNINKLINKNIDIIQELYSNNISLSIKELGNCTIECNYNLASTMIINLIKNSYTHNIDEGLVAIEINRDSIKISNSGSREELDSSKIFNRFYQGNSNAGTYGLGLPIIQSICKLYNFNLSYNFANNLHEFKIKFK